jgi:hypothetical protein
MRYIIILFLGLLQFETFGQKWTGKYHDYSGHELEFHSDSTFKYEYGFDLLHTWAIGKWTFKDDIVHLNFSNDKVYDTLVRANRADSLIESRDEILSKINDEMFAMLQLSSGGQSSEGITDKLMLKGKRLYLVDSKGQRITGRLRGIWPDKRWWGYKTWPVYYVKEQ